MGQANYEPRLPNMHRKRGGPGMHKSVDTCDELLKSSGGGKEGWAGSGRGLARVMRPGGAGKTGRCAPQLAGDENGGKFALFCLAPHNGDAEAAHIAPRAAER